MLVKLSRQVSGNNFLLTFFGTTPTRHVLFDPKYRGMFFFLQIFFWFCWLKILWVLGKVFPSILPKTNPPTYSKKLMLIKNWFDKVLSTFVYVFLLLLNRHQRHYVQAWIKSLNGRAKPIE